MPDNPNPSKYQKTNITPPPGTSGPGTHSVYIPSQGINGYVVNNVVYNIKPAAQQHVNENVSKGSTFRSLPPAKLPE